MKNKYDEAKVVELLKIDVDKLEIGMYVSKLDRPWTEADFLFQGFLLQSEDDVLAVRRQCRFVNIDLSRGFKKPLKPDTPASDSGIDKAYLEKVQAPEKKLSFAMEIGRAEMVYQSTKSLVKKFMKEVAAGRGVNIDEAKQAVALCVDSILNVPDALMWLSQLKSVDEYTAEHSLNVCILAIAFGRHIDLSVAELNNLGLCGMMHDMGKMKVPLEVLNKPGRLTPEELAIMQSHAQLGWELLKDSGIYPGAIHTAHMHHERLDGKGYPQGLFGDQIPLYAKMVAVVDMYDAITSDRVYQKGRSHHEATKILGEVAGAHLEDMLVVKFIECLGIYPAGGVVELTNGEVGIVVEVNQQAKLRPKVMLLLDEDKKPRRERTVDLSRLDLDASGQPYMIRRVTRPDEFGIDLVKYYKEGLLNRGLIEGEAA